MNGNHVSLDLVRRVLEIQREHYEMFGSWPSVQAVLSALVRGQP